MEKLDIYMPKNILALKHIARDYKQIKFAGLNSFLTINSHTHKKQVLVKTNKIREYHTILRTPHSCIIGLENTIGQLIGIAKQELKYTLLNDCLTSDYSADLWNTTLLQAIFGKNSPILLRLFLYMINAQVQVIKDNSLVWVQLNDIVQKNGSINRKSIVPIKIRMTLYNKSLHTLTSSPQSINDTRYPKFPTPIIMGQLLFNVSDSLAPSELQLLYQYKNSLINVSPHFQKYKIPSIPIQLEYIKELWQLIPTDVIPKNHLPFMLQSLVSMLSPNLI